MATIIIIKTIIDTINTFFYVYMLMILARCLLTWLPNVNWENPILSGLKSSVDIYLNLFKKFIPPLGMFDFSPIVACIVLYPINWIIINIVFVLVKLLGIVE